VVHEELLTVGDGGASASWRTLTDREKSLVADKA
jgi:hypothetical protein